MIEVIEPGFSTTVQDEGRPGYFAGGIAPSGAMDLLAYRLGNGIVGNDAGCASLELTFTGPKIRFDAAAAFAVTGGDLPVFLNGQEVPMWTCLMAQPDDVLHFGFLRSGVRAYLAVLGGIDVPLYLGSRSTHVLCQLGGLEGRKLQEGDRIPLGEGGVPRLGVALAARFVPVYQREVELRYVPGLFDYRLTEAGSRQFIDTVWTISPDADRTGIRLTSTNSDPLEFVARDAPFGAGSDPSNVVDAGYPLGSIQIPSGTVPILLSRDAVTAGGYCSVGAIITADLDLLGQGPTHGRLKFTPITMHEALTVRRARAALTREALNSLN